MKKLKLAELSVKSFVTKNNSLLQETIRGGGTFLGGNCNSDDLVTPSYTCTSNPYNTID